MPNVPRVKPVKTAESLATGIATAGLDTPVVSNALDVSEATHLDVSVDFVRGGAATAVVMNVAEGDTAGGDFFTIQKLDASMNATPLDITRTTSLSEKFTLPFDVTPYKFIKLTFTGTAATAADTVTVTANKTSA